MKVGYSESPETKEQKISTSDHIFETPRQSYGPVKSAPQKKRQIAKNGHFKLKMFGHTVFSLGFIGRYAFKPWSV